MSGLRLSIALPPNESSDGTSAVLFPFSALPSLRPDRIATLPPPLLLPLPLGPEEKLDPDTTHRAGSQKRTRDFPIPVIAVMKDTTAILDESVMEPDHDMVSRQRAIEGSVMSVIGEHSLLPQ